MVTIDHIASDGSRSVIFDQTMQNDRSINGISTTLHHLRLVPDYIFCCPLAYVWLIYVVGKLLRCCKASGSGTFQSVLSLINGIASRNSHRPLTGVQMEATGRFPVLVVEVIGDRLRPRVVRVSRVVDVAAVDLRQQHGMFKFNPAAFGRVPIRLYILISTLCSRSHVPFQRCSFLLQR